MLERVRNKKGTGTRIVSQRVQTVTMNYQRRSLYLLVHNCAAGTTPVVSATSTHTLRLCCVIYLFVFVSTLALFYCRRNVWFSSPKFHGHIQLSQTGGRKLVNV